MNQNSPKVEKAALKGALIVILIAILLYAGYVFFNLMII